MYHWLCPDRLLSLLFFALTSPSPHPEGLSPVIKKKPFFTLSGAFSLTAVITAVNFHLFVRLPSFGCKLHTVKCIDLKYNSTHFGKCIHISPQKAPSYSHSVTTSLNQRNRWFDFQCYKLIFCLFVSETSYKCNHTVDGSFASGFFHSLHNTFGIYPLCISVVGWFVSVFGFSCGYSVVFHCVNTAEFTYLFSSRGTSELTVLGYYE